MLADLIRAESAGTTPIRQQRLGVCDAVDMQRALKSRARAHVKWETIARHF